MIFNEIGVEISNEIIAEAVMKVRKKVKLFKRKIAKRIEKKRIAKAQEK